MTYFVKPEAAGILRNYNFVLGYYKNYVIIEDEAGELFYAECERDIFEIGTSVENSMLNPISNLPEKERIAITEEFGDD